jgi:hypothetical protein
MSIQRAPRMLRCTSVAHPTPYPGGQMPERCAALATHRLRTQTGGPAGVACEEHARAIVEEYREKLGWEWSMEPLIDG